jgi:glycerol-3-phosphate dehydrogenase
VTASPQGPSAAPPPGPTRQAGRPQPDSPSAPDGGGAPASRSAARDAADVDVVILGGGVNGAGVARDCALRGLRVALFERNDFAFGASGNSSGMIHGGPRYLTYDPSVTLSSCLDSGYIQDIAPHLLFRIPFLFPVAKSRIGRPMLELMDGFFEAYDRYQPLKRGKPHARLDADDLRRLEPGLVGEMLGGMAFDEWGIDGPRLVMANIVDAREHGAAIQTHTTVEKIERGAEPSVQIVTSRDLLTGKATQTRCRVVVNATGAWAPLAATLAGLPQKAAPIRGGKGIHVVYDRRISNFAVVAQTVDGRQIFIYPWENTTVLGTTDDDYYGDLDNVNATADEVRYLEQAIAHMLPGIRDARAITTYAGVRPTLYAWGKNEDKLSREHEVIDHRDDGAAGIFSMVGGKLASYRIFAKETTDAVMTFLGRNEPCSTHRLPLPGGESRLDALKLASDLSIDAVSARRLVYRHGGRADAVFSHEPRPGSRPTPRSGPNHHVVCACEPVLEAEVRHVIRHELARTVSDVSRRTRLGLGACGGMRCALACGRILAEETGAPPVVGRSQAIRFLSTQAARRGVALGPIQARQEALTLAALRSEVGLSPEPDHEGGTS